MARAVHHVGVPGHQFQTGVMWHGALVFGPLAFREFQVIQEEIAPLDNHLLNVSFGYGEPMRLVDRRGTDNPRIRRYLEGGRIPIPHVEEYETMWPVGAPLFLARDDIPRFFEWFAHNFAFVIHEDFRVGVESPDGVPSCAPGDAERWLAVRNMFLNELGGYDGSQQSLWLLQAIPRAWLRPGNRMAVTDMGTCFGGKIDLEVQMAEDGNSVMVRAKLGKLAVQPKEIRIRLRSGYGRPLVSATVNGQATPVQAGDIILLPVQTDGSFEVVGKFD